MPALPDCVIAPSDKPCAAYLRLREQNAALREALAALLDNPLDMHTQARAASVLARVEKDAAGGGR